MDISNEPDMSVVDSFYYSGWINSKTPNSAKPYNFVNAAVSFTGMLNVYGLTSGSSYTCVQFSSASQIPSTCNHLAASWKRRYVLMFIGLLGCCLVVDGHFVYALNLFVGFCFADLTSPPRAPRTPSTCPFPSPTPAITSVAC